MKFFSLTRICHRQQQSYIITNSSQISNYATPTVQILSYLGLRTSQFCSSPIAHNNGKKNAFTGTSPLISTSTCEFLARRYGISRLHLFLVLHNPPHLRAHAFSHVGPTLNGYDTITVPSTQTRNQDLDTQPVKSTKIQIMVQSLTKYT